MTCATEPSNKKEFGIAVYEKLRELYGAQDSYDVPQIEHAVAELGYPDAWACWALAAFMLPANAGEYFRAKGTPMDVLEMKRTFILEMTDGKKSSLTLPRVKLHEYDIEPNQLSQFLTKKSMTSVFSRNNTLEMIEALAELLD